MKEGLRSGKLRVERDKQLSVEKKGDELKQGGSDSGGEKIRHLVSIGQEETEGAFVGDRAKEGGELGREECGEDGVMVESNNVGEDGIGETRCVDNGEKIDDDGVERKKVKEKEVEGIVGRVLRSRTVVIGGCDKGVSDGAVVAKSRESDGSHEQCTEANNGGVDQLGESENMGVGKIEKKRRRVDDDGLLEKKKAKEEQMDGRVPSAVRALRSRFVVLGVCDKGVSDGAVVEKSRESDGSHGQCTVVNNEGVDQLGESENMGVGKIGKKRRWLDDGQEVDDDGIEKKKAKEEEMDGSVTSGGRALRSRFVVIGECDKVESDGILVGKSRGRDGSHKDCTKVKNEGGDHLVGGIKKKLKGKRGRPRKVEKEESDRSGGELKKTNKLKGKRGRPRKVEKRGRPRKVEKEESDRSGGELKKTNKLKGKRGRPRKVEKEENDCSGGELKKTKKLKRKRGRPRKVEKEESDLLVGQLREKLKSEHERPLKVKETNLKGKLDKEGNTGLKSQERMKANVTTNGSYLDRGNIRKELDVKTSSPAKRDKKGKDLVTEDSEDGEGKKEMKQKENEEQKNKQKDRDGELARSRQKQLVRDKIVELILRAGWTIQYRPRNGKEYKDAVYVSPAGKTHWSVTKAYKFLKKHFENGDGNSEVCKAGFQFTPIPVEEVGILTRIQLQKRKGKKNAKQKGEDGRDGEINAKLKKGKGRNIEDGVMEEKKKKKLGKSLKGKRLLLEQHDSTSTACKGRLTSVQDREQHKTKNRKRCALLVRNSKNADSENDGYIPYDGKRTVFAWMIDLETLSLDSKVKYMNKRKTRVLLEGRITRDGIHCGCCKEIVSISKFVTHARSDHSEPFKHIYLDSGASLLQCLLDSWNKQDEYERRGFHFVDVNREDPNDDTCGICGDGGNLICCDGCPSTFHQSCLEIKKFPSGEWYCVYCSCKFCGMFGGNTYQRKVNENVAASALMTCQLCEEKYHQSCIQAKDAVNDDSSGPSFCGNNCQQLFKSLQMLLGVRRELEDGFSLTLIRRSDIGSSVSLSDTTQKDDCDSKLIECNSKLAVAFLIMDECFLPMVDQRSGVNLIHNILYNRGSNFSRLNYTGFFTAILERGDEIISAATIRIHGNYLAEMPFIGTRYMYRRQGMWRRLLTAIESALCSLNVERLVIPAISELRETWTSVFGFKPLEESSKQKMKNMNLLVFPGVDILQKPLLQQLTEANMIPVEGLSSTELENHQIGQEVLCDTNERLLARSGSEATVPCGNEGNDELAAVKSNKQRLGDVSQENLEGKSNTITIPPGSECDVHEQTEEVNEYQGSASGSDVRAVKVDIQQNLHITAEVESKSFTLHHIDSETTYSGIKIIPASMEGTKNSDCELRIEDINSHDEGSICRSSENSATELQNMALVHEVKVCDENIACHDSEITTQASHDARDLKHHDSQHKQVAGSASCLDGKMLETCEAEDNHPATQHTPTVMVAVHTESIKCCNSEILTETRNVASDVFHPTSLIPGRGDSGGTSEAIFVSNQAG